MLNDQLQKQLGGLMSAFLVILSVFFIALTVNAVQKIPTIGEPTPNPRQISVEATGESKIEPNLAIVNFSLRTEGETQEEAQSENATNANALLELIIAAGIPETDVQTQNYNLSENRVYNSDINDFENRGFVANQSIRVEIRDQSLVETIIELGKSEGVTNVQGPNFQIDDPDVYKDMARADAIAKAQAKAEAIAKDLGVQLGDVQHYNEWNYNQPMPYYDSRIESAVGYGGAATPEIAPGQETVSLTVSIGFELK